MKFNNWKLPIGLLVLAIIFLFFSISANIYISVFTVSVEKNAEVIVKNGILYLHPVDKNYGFAAEVNFRSEYVFASLDLAIFTLITNIELATVIQLPIGFILVLSLLALYKRLEFPGIMPYILTYLSVTYMLAILYSNYSVFSISMFLLFLSISLLIKTSKKPSKKDIITLILILVAMPNYHYTPPFIFLFLPLSFIIYDFFIKKSKVPIISYNTNMYINIELTAIVIFIMKIIEGSFLSFYNFQIMVKNFPIEFFKVINSFLERSSALNPRVSNPVIYYTEILSFLIEIVGMLSFIFLKYLSKAKKQKRDRFSLIVVLVIFVLVSSIAETLVYFSTPAGLVLSIPRTFQIFGHLPLICSLLLLNYIGSSSFRKHYLKTIKVLLLFMIFILIFLKSLGLFARIADQNVYYSYSAVLRREDLHIANFIAKNANYSTLAIYGSGDTIGYIALLTDINYTSHLFSSLPDVNGAFRADNSNALIILPEKGYRWIFYGVRQQIQASQINVLINMLLFAGDKIYDDNFNFVLVLEKT